ncbi:hypothetical protein [Limosilactobacillus avium]|nr:hypothetical protein [Limosilactobacillus avium]
MINWDDLQRQYDESNPYCPWIEDEPSWYDKQREKEEYQADMEEE